MADITYDSWILDRVRRILENYSGGIKFTELLTLILPDVMTLKIDTTDFSDRLEKVIRKSDDIKILDYTWKSAKRAKMFVYTA